MKSYTVVIVADGQISFKTEQAFNRGEQSLLVFLNGLLCTEGPGEDYEETDNMTVTFNISVTPIVEKDIIVLIDISSGTINVPVPTTVNTSKTIYDYYYVTAANQIRFDLVNPLASTPAIYLNGLNTISYSIKTDAVTNTNYIETKSPLNVGDYIIVQTQSPKSIVVGDYGDPIYKRYGNSQRLMFNQIYTCTIEDLSQQLSVDFKFTSRYDPLYCPTKMVREDVQPIVDLDDDNINFIIYQNSMKMLVDMQGSGNMNFKMPTPYLLTNLAMIPYNIQQHIRYESVVDILNAVYLKMSGRQGRTSKKLGNMQIDQEIRLPYLKDYMQRFQDKLKQFPVNLSYRHMIQSGIKGNSADPWPVASPRRSF